MGGSGKRGGGKEYQKLWVLLQEGTILLREESTLNDECQGQRKLGKLINPNEKKGGIKPGEAEKGG